MSEYYEKRKADARQKGIEVQNYLADHSVSWAELAEAQDYLEKLARRWGLCREFKENGLL